MGDLVATKSTTVAASFQMGIRFRKWGVVAAIALSTCGLGNCTGQSDARSPQAADGKHYLPGEAPKITGAKLFGVRPGSPFLFTVPATGQGEIKFSAENLPSGLTLDAGTGRITGALGDADKGEHVVTLHAESAYGEASEEFKIVVGDTIALTPPMGWNSWNCWAEAVDQEKVLASAKAMVDKGLVKHGWTYINIDDTWQGERGGPFNAIQPNEKFPDMKGLCDQVHAMGLKIGIYSTPWITSYAGYNGGSSNDPDGKWSKDLNKREFRRDGEHLFAANDAKQWAAWGFDYLKYDWNPRSAPAVSHEFFIKQVKDMSDALNASGRDILYSYSNSLPFDQIGDVAPYLNCWRTTGDIRDTWFSMTSNGFSQARWVPFAKSGHWNDPDMLVVGWVGWGPKLHSTMLTPDEQYTHISLWCLLSSPLLIGCDMTRLDDFTVKLLTNDEVLAIDQDPSGHQANIVAQSDDKVTIKRPGTRPGDKSYPRTQVWAKELADGSKAAGLFNLGDAASDVTVTWKDLGVSGSQVVRDLWKQQDVGAMDGQYTVNVPAHGVVLVKIQPAK